MKFFDERVSSNPYSVHYDIDPSYKPTVLFNIFRLICQKFPTINANSCLRTKRMSREEEP